MNSYEYDLDTSGGLMEQIQKLVAPPISDEALRRSRRQPKEYRRHGKAINHDYCDSCHEGGDLLCCDRCPVSFHLQCHDPPLEEDDIPPGEWICHKCKVSPKPEKDDDASSTKSGGSSGRSAKAAPTPPPVIIPPAPLVTFNNPLQTLAEAAQVLNPMQFELPKDIACSTPLPGTSKRKWWGRDRNAVKKQAHELDNGLVPLPAKLCFTCNKSCRIAPLIQCDYCPCLFHMDCLNPPLTSTPTGRWMCPNHAENFIDENLLKTVSVSERVKLWDKFNDRVNQHSLKIDFLKKIHRQSPPFRIKVRHPKRKAAQIPEAIREFYKHPPDPLPVLSHDTMATEMEGTKTEWKSDTTLEEQEQWLKSVVSLQTSIAQLLAKNQLERSNSLDGGKNSETVKTEKPTASVQPVVQKDLSEVLSQGSGDCHDSAAVSDMKSKAVDCEQSHSNGPVMSSPELCNNGPLDVSKGAVSLLTSSACASLNGDVEMMDVSNQTAKVDGTAARSHGNSSQVSPQSNIVKVTWPSGDKVSGTPTITGAASSLGNRNIVISAINKPNSSVVTRVVPGQGSKVLPATSIVTKGSGSVPTSILSPRTGTQPIVKVSSNTVTTTSSVKTAATGSLTPSGSSTKVITVNTASTASKMSSLSGSKTSSLGGQSSSAIIALNQTLQQCLEGTAGHHQGGSDLELSRLDEKLIQILAWQRLQQLMPNKNTPDNTTQKKSSLNGLLQSPGLQEVQARALLCPLSGKGQAVPMPYRTLCIGTGADMDVCLSQYGQCNFISAKHAFIFYDETSKHYELLNYSEHGTTVDNVLYSCDFSDKPATTPQPAPVVAAVRSIINNKPKMKADERLTVSSRTNELRRVCNCKGSSSSLIGGSGAGWEGTALLHHGSYIKVGCIQFVFSIVDHATNQPVHSSLKREPMSLLKSHLRAVP